MPSTRKTAADFTADVDNLWTSVAVEGSIEVPLGGDKTPSSSDRWSNFLSFRRATAVEACAAQLLDSFDHEASIILPRKTERKKKKVSFGFNCSSAASG